jgi:uncharacterized protein (DUF1330 family)
MLDFRVGKLKEIFMTTSWSFVCVAVAGVIVGAVGMRVLQAQTPPPIYLVAEIQVTDPETYKTYVPKATQVVVQYQGQYLVRGGKTTSLEGTAPAGRVVVVKFPSMAALQKFWNSPEYRQVAPIRRKASKSRVFAVEGVLP